MNIYNEPKKINIFWPYDCKKRSVWKSYLAQFEVYANSLEEAFLQFIGMQELGNIKFIQSNHTASQRHFAYEQKMTCVGVHLDSIPFDVENCTNFFIECDAPVPQSICTNDKYDYRNSTMDDIDDEDWQLQVEKAEVITNHLIEYGYKFNPIFYDFCLELILRDFRYEIWLYDYADYANRKLIVGEPRRKEEDPYNRLQSYLSYNEFIQEKIDEMARDSITACKKRYEI